jgi:hypothetical protein
VRGTLAKPDTGAAGAGARIGERSGLRVLALYEPGRSGEATLAQAARLIEQMAAVATVVTLAPQDTHPPHCAVYADAYNDGVRDEAAAELDRARVLLGAAADRARYEVLVDGRDPPLETRAAHGFDLVLLPSRPSLSRRRARTCRRLRASTDAEVRLIAVPRGRRARA